MYATIRTLAVLLAVGFFASFASAQWRYGPPGGVPQAPDMCGPGIYMPNCCGTWWGPVYCVRPPWAPFNGPCPTPCAGGPNLGFPTHPFARSPRDFFMIGD